MNSFRKYFVFFVPILLLLATACGDDKNDIPFEIIQTSIKGTPIELHGEIKLSSADFEYLVMAEWCEVTKENNSLKLQAGANYDTFNRSTEIIITSGNTEYRIPVTQTGTLFEFLDETVGILNFSLTGGQRSVQLLTNVEYEVVIPDQDKDWIEVVKGDDDINTVFVKEAAERRFSEISFKYLEKTIDITINQLDYLGYHDLLGPAIMTYTNSSGETVETPIEILPKEELKTFLVKGVFESGVEREIPLTFVDDEDHQGELRFYPGNMDPNFIDLGMDENIRSLGSVVFVKQFFRNPLTDDEPDDIYALFNSYKNYYYPALFEADERGNHYTFQHSDKGVPPWMPAIFGRDTKGLLIKGVSADGKKHYGDPYDTLFDIKIFKE